MRAIREQIASAIHIIIQIARLADGTRKVTHVTEITGMEGEVVTMQDLFRFEQTRHRQRRPRHRRVPVDGHPAALRREVRDRRHPPAARSLHADEGSLAWTCLPRRRRFDPGRGRSARRLRSAPCRRTCRRAVGWRWRLSGGTLDHRRWRDRSAARRSSALGFLQGHRLRRLAAAIRATTCGWPTASCNRRTSSRYAFGLAAVLASPCRSSVPGGIPGHHSGRGRRRALASCCRSSG